ncbi:MAG: hypothetical protein A2277_04995 [Desulfobacterales bacterium RIFOXYA12_FULL_46_15]|nr:MAG: hypothetical protein A2277_04995 [Desulfobacterales bacterium RIFOXYA12_FULL_46_15]
MKKGLISCIIFFFIQITCVAGDFVVELVEENYRETQGPVSYSPVVYHTLQVHSEVGPKLLILIGNNSYYRKWLRQYIAKGNAFIVKVSDDQDNLFLKSDAFEIDEKKIHPFNLTLYRQGEEKTKNGLSFDDLEKLRKRAAINKYGNLKSSIPATKADAALKVNADQKAEQEKDAQRKMLEKHDQAREEEKKQLQTSKILEAQQNREAEELKRQQEQERNDHEEFLMLLAEQKFADETRRMQELEKRWQELKKRLLADERILKLDQTARAREIERRWQELKQRFDLE